MNITSDIAPEVLKGKLALVTGGGQGGLIARGLANAGARVIVTDINAQTAQQVADEILAQGRQAWAFRLDVTSTEACQGLASQVEKTLVPLTCLSTQASSFEKAWTAQELIANPERTMNQCDGNVPADSSLVTCAAPGRHSSMLPLLPPVPGSQVSLAITRSRC